MEKVLLVCVAIFLHLCVASPTGQACSTDLLNTTMVSCMINNGFTQDLIEKFIPNHSGALNINVNDLTMLCANKDGYLRATRCIVDVVNRCNFTGNLINLNFNQTAQYFSLICDDPHFKMSCLTQLLQNPLPMESCTSRNYDIAKEMETKTIPQVTCESAKVGITCALDILKPCDEHTATVYSEAATSMLPALCGSK